MSFNSYRHDIVFINKLAAQAKQDFPDLEDEKIEVFVVTRSDYNKGFWGIIFPLPPGTFRKGYQDEESLDFWHS
jgi:hypothetical protein